MRLSFLSIIAVAFLVGPTFASFYQQFFANDCTGPGDPANFTEPIGAGETECVSQEGFSIRLTATNGDACFVTLYTAPGCLGTVEGMLDGDGCLSYLGVGGSAFVGCSA